MRQTYGLIENGASYQLKQIDRDAFTPIDFSHLAALAQKVGAVASECRELSWQAELLLEPKTKYTRSPKQELLGSIHHHVFECQKVAMEICNLATSDSTQAAN